MINLKQRISLLFIIFFFLFSSQEAFAFGGFFKKIIKEFAESGSRVGIKQGIKESGEHTIKQGIKESGESSIQWVDNLHVGLSGVKIYRNYCSKAENKKNSDFCRDPDNYCNQKKHVNYYICREAIKELKKEKRGNQNGGFPSILVIIIIGIFVYFIFIKPKNSENKSSSNKDQNQWKRQKFIGRLSYGEGRRKSTRLDTVKPTPYLTSKRLEDQRPLHSHLLVDRPHRVEIDLFQEVCEESLGRVLSKSSFEVYRDGMCHIELNDKGYFDLQDVFQITDYIFQPRHIEVDDTGMFDTSNIVISSNYSLK